MARDQSSQQIDFASLDKAISSLGFGTVSASKLAEKNAQVPFLARLVAEHIRNNPAEENKNQDHIRITTGINFTFGAQ